MKPHSSNPLPALLRYFRQKAGLTQQDVAAALSISRSGYANYEEGRNIPNIEQAIKLSELLNHDFLYAYTLSSRYMQGHPKPLQIVMEDNSYMTAIESNQSTADMLGNYRSLSDSDRQLIDTFVANLASKNSRLEIQYYTHQLQ